MANARGRGVLAPSMRAMGRILLIIVVVLVVAFLVRMLLARKR